MTLIKWKIRDKIVSLPKDWDKAKVVAFMNTDIKVCIYCGKVDISTDHYEKGCDPNFIRNQENLNDNW